MEWEKTFVNDMTDKRINLKYTSHTAQYPKKIPKQPNKKFDIFPKKTYK